MKNNTKKRGHYVVIYRPKSAENGKKAANYAKSHLLNAKYKVNTKVEVIDPTYCSKIVWKAYNNGVGPSATRIDGNHIVNPYYIYSEILGLKGKAAYKFLRK